MNDIKIAQPFRSPGEFTCYLQGARAAAEALGFSVDADAWGGGVPNELTLYTDSPIVAEPDVYEREAENATIPDTATEEDSSGSEADGESLAPA